MKFAAVAVLAVALCAVGAFGQVASKGKWTPGRFDKFQISQVDASTFTLPKQNNALLLAKEERMAKGGFEFATPVAVSINPNNAGRVFHTAKGNVWVVRIQSEGAHSLSLIFDKYDLPQGAELYVYNGEKTLGAFTAANNKRHGKMSVVPLDGSVVTVELFMPIGTASETSISISYVSHGYKSLALGDSGRCNINVVCPEGDAWTDQINGAVMLLTQLGSRYCSGSLINNALNDGRQLFLTAYHCASGDIDTDRIMFNYQSSVCALADQVDGPTTFTASGLINLAAYAQSDFSLYEVEDVIPDSYNAFLNGFSAVNTPATAMVGIHHPSGDIKKISFSNKTAVPDRWNVAEPGYYHWEVPSWDDGTTEPGSSGSPLFNEFKQIVGQLHGGAASCTNIAYDTYGAVWASWDQGTEKLQPFLDPRNTGTLQVDGIYLAEARRRTAAAKAL